MAEPIELFLCERRTMRLSRPSCARLWQSAQDKLPDPWEGRAACRTCAIGRANAGKPAEPNAEYSELWRMVCPRCTRPAERLIGNCLCVSCYNRDREAAIGRNGKGGRPLLCDVLHGETVAVILQNDIVYVHQDRVVGLSELIIRTAKAEKGPVAFGITPKRWAGASPQAELPI